MKMLIGLIVFSVVELSASSESRMHIRSQPISGEEQDVAFKDALIQLLSGIEPDRERTDVLAKYAAAIFIESHKKVTEKNEFYAKLVCLRDELIMHNAEIVKNSVCLSIPTTNPAPGDAERFRNTGGGKELDHLNELEREILERPWGRVIENFLKKNAEGEVDPELYVNEDAIAGTWVAHLNSVGKSLSQILATLQEPRSQTMNSEPDVFRQLLSKKADCLALLVDFLREAALDKKIGRDYKDLVRKVNEEMKRTMDNESKRRRT